MMDGLLSSGDRDAPDPDPASEPAPDRDLLLNRLAEETLEEYVEVARRWIRRLGIDAIGLDPRGVVDAAWAMLCQEIRDGRIAPGLTPTELGKALGLRLLKALFRERRRQRARKRGWGNVASMGDAVIELADPHGGRAVEEIEARDWCDRLLHELECHDPALRAVLERKLEERSSAAIAAELGVSVRTVERMMCEIRSILSPHLRTGAGIY